MVKTFLAKYWHKWLCNGFKSKGEFDWWNPATTATCKLKKTQLPPKCVPISWYYINFKCQILYLHTVFYNLYTSCDVWITPNAKFEFHTKIMIPIIHYANDHHTMINDLYTMVHIFMIHDPLSFHYDTWPFHYDTWPFHYDTWPLHYYTLPLEFRLWYMTLALWYMTLFTMVHDPCTVIHDLFTMIHYESVSLWYMTLAQWCRFLHYNT